MKTPQKRLLTPEEVRLDFQRRGVSIRSWALKNGVDPNTAANVVAGRSKGNLGKAHEIAVLLRIKDGVIEREAA